MAESSCAECYSSGGVAAPLQYSKLLRLSFCGDECRDAYICRRAEYRPRGAAHVAVYIGDAILGAFDEHALAAYRSAAAHDQYVLPTRLVARAIVAQRRQAPVRIGPELRRKDGHDATFDEYAALSADERAAQFSDSERAKAERELAERARRAQERPMAVDEPRPAPVVPTSLLATPSPLPATAELDGNMLMFILSNAAEQSKAIGDDIAYWQNLMEAFPTLQTTISDPERVRALLVQVPIKDVHSTALRFIQDVETDGGRKLHEMLASNVVEGIARRYSTVTRAPEALWKLCLVAIKWGRIAVLQQLLTQNAERGCAVVDLNATVSWNMLEAFSSDPNRNNQALDSLLNWRGELGVRAQFANTVMHSMSTILHLFSDYMLVAKYAARRGLLEQWFEETLQSIAPDYNAMRVALLNTPIIEDTTTKLDLSKLMPLLAERRRYQTMDNSLLPILRQWRGDNGEYIDFAAIFYAQLERMQSKLDVDIRGLHDPRIHFYFDWRSPDNSRFIDLSNMETLQAIYLLGIDMPDPVMRWIGPTGQRVPAAKYLYAAITVYGYITSRFLEALASYSAPGSPLSEYSEIEARIILRELMTHIDHGGDQQSIIRIISRIYVTASYVPGAILCVEWLWYNGGQYLFEMLVESGLEEHKIFGHRMFFFQTLPQKSLADTIVFYARLLFRYRRSSRMNRSTNVQEDLQTAELGGIWNRLTAETRAEFGHDIEEDSESSRIEIVDRIARELVAIAQTLRPPGSPLFTIGEIEDSYSTY